MSYIFVPNKIRDFTLERKIKMLEKLETSFSIEFLDNKKYKFSAFGFDFIGKDLSTVLADALECFEKLDKMSNDINLSKRAFQVEKQNIGDRK